MDDGTLIDTAPPLGLSPRQWRIAQLVARGEPNKIIAYELGISDSTVKACLRQTFTQTHARTRAQLSVWVKQHSSSRLPTGTRPAGLSHTLTPREQQVLACIQRGLSNMQIAREHGMNESTVKSHLRNIFRKTGSKNRAMLACIEFADTDPATDDDAIEELQWAALAQDCWPGT